MNGVKTDQLILEEYRKNGYLPHGTLAKIAREAGLSRERIRQVAEKLNIPPVLKDRNHKTRLCIFCKDRFSVRDHMRQYCSKSCRQTALFYKNKYLYMETRCKYKGCGVIILHYKSKTDTSFCSREHNGKMRAHEIGFGKYPEHRVTPERMKQFWKEWRAQRKTLRKLK